MKYAYVVTRTVKGEPPNLVSIPNLGVHTSYEKARKHFDNVRLDRINSGARNLYTHPGYTQPGPVSVLRTSLFNYEDGRSEEIRLEKWVIGKKTKATSKRIGLPHAYLCGKCAKKFGGVWPKDHVATAHIDKCPYCKEQESLVCVDDYLWNDEKTLKNWD